MGIQVYFELDKDMDNEAYTPFSDEEKNSIQEHFKNDVEIYSGKTKSDQILTIFIPKKPGGELKISKNCCKNNLTITVSPLSLIDDDGITKQIPYCNKYYTFILKKPKTNKQT